MPPPPFRKGQRVTPFTEGRAAAFISLVPVLGTMLGAIILHEMPSAIDSVAVISISQGALFAGGGFTFRQQTVSG
jgi:threonine/homoserine efflux transporter RhtA